MLYSKSLNYILGLIPNCHGSPVDRDASPDQSCIKKFELREGGGGDWLR